MKTADHNVPSSADAPAELKQVRELLSAHAGFMVVPVRVSLGPVRRMARLGLAIKRFRFRKFGAEFDGAFTLFDFRLHHESPRRLVLDLHWHLTQIGDGRSVFIHFVDAADEVRFYGDYPLDGEEPDVLGFLYSRRLVEVPKEAPAGMYRVRLGVWCPAENRLTALGRFRGCLQASGTWYHHAVILDSVEISSECTA